MLDRGPNRLSCHTRYTAPVVRSTAISALMSPVRWLATTPAGNGESGSITIPRKNVSTMVSFLSHVAPWSEDRITAMWVPRVPWSFLGPRTSVITLISSPSNWSLSGSTAIWLPMVWAMTPARKILRAGSQVSPPSVVRANRGSPAKAMAFSNACWFWLPLGGEITRSHTAYTKSESFGSAVMAFLSLNAFGLSARLRETGSSHVAPWVVERMTSMSSGFVSKPPALVSVDKLIKYAVPSGEMATHGSEARSKFPPFAGVPPVQLEDLVCALIVQFAPLLRLVALTMPSDPPLFHRSCCQASMMMSGFDGSTITWGSTSLFTNWTAGTPPTSRNPVSPSQAAIGLAPETGTNGPVVEGSAVAGTEPTTARTATAVPSATILLLERCMPTPPSVTRDIVRSPVEGGDDARLVHVCARPGPAAEPLDDAPAAIERWREDVDRDMRPSTDGRGLVHVSHPS